MVSKGQKQAPEIRGLKRRMNANGEARLYWTCSERAAKLGYDPKTVAVHQTDPQAIKSYCGILEGQMLLWIARKEGSAVALPEAITVSYLVNLFMDAPSSKFQRVKWKTREDYTNLLMRIDRSIGHVRVADITMDVAQSWYDNVRWPEGRGHGKPDHVTMARSVMAMIRRIVKFGFANKQIPECAQASAALAEIAVETPQPREQYLTYEDVLAVIEKALETGKLSIALGTALQFEGLFRQKDVIGEWEPIEGEARSPYVLNGRQWVNGLTWDMIGSGVFQKKTVKRGKKVSHDVSEYPLASRIIAMIPDEQKRFGAVIIDERTGRPYARWAYGKIWQEVAREAGLPEGVWNMDSRAGGISEALAAQTSLSDVQKVAGHADPRMTTRYERWTGLDQAKRAAKARVAFRGGGTNLTPKNGSRT